MNKTAARGPACWLPRNSQFFLLCEALHKRKNYLFLGSDNGGTAAAVLYSVLASSKANQVEPFAYVRDLLVQLSGHSPSAAAALLHDAGLTAHPRSSSVLVEVAGLPGATESKTSDLSKRPAEAWCGIAG